MERTGKRELIRVPIEYHADDYGLFPMQSTRILECHQYGNLNGVSVMPNSTFLKESMEQLRPYQKEIAVTVHLNFIEGKSLCPAEEVPLLTDQNGIFRISFGGILLHSFMPGRRQYREQLKKEIRAQIFAVKACLEEGTSLRIDGHAHYHMLPVIFDALMDVVQEENLDVSYIRIPREYLSLYLPHWNRLRDFAPINLVKVLILNFLSWRNRRKYGYILGSLEQRLFMGVFLSGSMYGDNVAPILPSAIRLAEKKGWGLELLAHPGGVYEDDDIACLTNADDVAFLTNPARCTEATLFLPNKKVM